MSAEESWHIVLDTNFEGGGGGGASAGAEGTSGQQGENPQQRKSFFEDGGKVFAAVAGVSSILAILIRAMKDSVVFSTAFNTIMTIISAIADLILIAFWPIIMVVIQALLEFLPIAMQIGKWLAPMMQKIADGLSVWFKTGDPTQFIDATADAIKQIVEVISEWLANNSTKIVEGMIRVLQGMFTVIQDLTPIFNVMMRTLLPLVVNLLTTIFDYITSFVGNYIVAAFKMRVLGIDNNMKPGMTDAQMDAASAKNSADIMNSALTETNRQIAKHLEGLAISNSKIANRLNSSNPIIDAQVNGPAVKTSAFAVAQLNQF